MLHGRSGYVWGAPSVKYTKSSSCQIYFASTANYARTLCHISISVPAIFITPPYIDQGCSKGRYILDLAFKSMSIKILIPICLESRLLGVPI